MSTSIRARLLTLVVASVVAGTALARAQTNGGDVRGFVDSFITAFNNLDWERFRSHFSDDVTVFFPSPYRAERASGRAAVEAEFGNVFHRWRDVGTGPPYLDIRPQDVEIQEYPGFAVVTFHLGEAPQLGRRTLVLRRQNGDWKIVHLHASVREVSQ